MNIINVGGAKYIVSLQTIEDMIANTKDVPSSLRGIITFNHGLLYLFSVE